MSYSNPGGRPAGDDIPADVNPNPALAQVAFDPYGRGTSPAAAVEAHGHSMVAHQFDDLAQQHEASTLGMWGFLATEIMFFGGALLGYAIYRHAWERGLKGCTVFRPNRITGAVLTGPEPRCERCEIVAVAA